MDTLLLWVIGIALIAIFFIPYWMKHRKKEREAIKIYEDAQEQGIPVPDTLHPVVNPDMCIGTANCIKVCPEKEVLALVSGKAVAIQPTRCVGHGLCERSCPVEAIQLVIGSATRGVDIPRIDANFETNVPGIFIIGELSGMGLIKNCFEQARQCIEGIVQTSPSTHENKLDVLIVGCGPAGLAAALYSHHYGLKFLVLEREPDIGGTVRHYPRHKIVMTTPFTIPGYGTLDQKELSKEELMALWQKISAPISSHIHTRETFQGAIPLPDGGFEVHTDKGTYQTQRIILSIGRRGAPRKLNIPGEALPHVYYSLLEPEHFQHSRITVVGGGDSAVEAALALAEQPGNKVYISYRRARFFRLKPLNQKRIEEAIQSGKIVFLPETHLMEILPKHIRYQDKAGTLHEMENDYVFIFIGGTLPTPLLKKLGIKIDTKFGEPLNR